MADLALLSESARVNPRKRLNRNLHGMEDPVHRLLNALEPGTYIRPHRHLSPPKTETIVVVSGELGLVLFDDAGNVRETVRLEAGGERFGADLPATEWHTLVALRPGTVFFETKSGPYARPVIQDLLPGTPAEEDPTSAALERQWRLRLESAVG
jgi:cupin fold WbuC family metalloprotein